MPRTDKDIAYTDECAADCHYVAPPVELEPKGKMLEDRFDAKGQRLAAAAREKRDELSAAQGQFCRQDLSQQWQHSDQVGLESISVNTIFANA